MGKRKSKEPRRRPAETPMTDLGRSAEDEPVGAPSNCDQHAAGTAGGGAASGGLGGVNRGAGEPGDDVDLEGALGSGSLDNVDENEDGPPYSGPSGGAVGGTPAEKRATGGHLNPHRPA